MSYFDVVECDVIGEGYITKDTAEPHTHSVLIKDRRLYQYSGQESQDLNWEGDLYFWYNGTEKDEHWFASFTNGNLVKLELVTRDEANRRLTK